jgi:hypothetical protein
MRFASMEEKSGAAQRRLPSGFNLSNRTRRVTSTLLLLSLIFFSTARASVNASSTSTGNDVVAYALQAGADARQKGELARPYDVLRRGLDANNYLAPLLELRNHEAEYLASDVARESYLEYITLLYSYVGDYREAYAYEDKLLASFKGLDKIREMYAKDLTSSPVDNYRPRSAIEAIASIADKHQVIMINEEHRTPVHRALTLQLLSVLYAKGFRYFAAETIDEKDTELSRRGYATQKTGFYTSDPVYADVIRTALKLGYKVVPYEYMKDCTPKPDNPMSCQNERERGQAQNLFDRILKNDPQAKIFVHVGRSHNAKINNDGQFAYMGWYFREITKIDPFVIDQVRMSERRSPSDEHPLYRYAIRRGWIKESTVFQSASGDLWTDDKNIADVRVFQPRAEYVNGRPTWLRMGGLRHASPLDLKKLKVNAQDRLFKAEKPLLIQAFVEGEGADAVPIDQLILYPGKPIPELMLPKGSFQVRAMDESGTVTGHYKFAVR